ncbi:MAG: gamma carbonic anhydrase family protein [Gammaproteobacteria bacterium]|nr:gamma carbonic anhydrase family protein [Gammaproteobacteria bacterium]
MIYDLAAQRVQLLGGGHFIAPNATIIGQVTLEANVSVWFNTVIRGDTDQITIGANSNIQDSSVLHTDEGIQLTVGQNVTVGHQVMLHGCTVGDGSLIGIGSIILNNARIGRGCLIGANSLIPENREIPDGALVMGSPGKVVRMLTEAEQANLLHSAAHYVDNGQRFARDLHPAQ